VSLRENFTVTERNHLALHKVDLVDLCARYGTPLFVFDENCLTDNFERFRRAFESNYPKVIVCYSVKTNFNLSICKVLREKGAYAEVSSEIELHAVEEAGYNGSNIIVDGLYKPKELLRKVLEKEVLLINVESFAEMERLNRIAGEMSIKQAIGLRVNSAKSRGFLANLNPRRLRRAIVCPECRFGFPLGNAYLAFEKASRMKNLRVEGIMTHNNPFYDGTAKILMPLVHKVHRKLGIEITYLNIGGGFIPETIRSVNTTDLVQDLIRQKLGLRSVLDKISKSGTSIEQISKSVTNDIREKIGDLPQPTIVAEPGSFIVEPSGIVLLRVDHIQKRSDGFNWVIVDGGTNLMPALNTVYFRHEILVANKVTCPREKLVNVAGPLCYTNDHIAIKTNLPQMDEGDIIAVLDCGAYTLCRSNQFLHPRPASVLLNSSNKVKVIRMKETYRDVFRKDVFHDYGSAAVKNS